MITGAPVNVLDFGAVGDGVTDDTAAIQAAIDSVVAGGTLYVPASSGHYLYTSLTIAEAITIAGDGFSADQNSATLGAAKWTDGSMSGSVLRSTSTSGVAITIGQPSLATLQYNFSNIMLLGSATSAVIGTLKLVLFGDSSQSSGSGSSLWSNVCLGNASILMDADNIEQCLFERVSYRGCATGLRITNTACNANSWRACEWQACSTIGVIFTAAGNGNTFDGDLMQGLGADGMSIMGSGNRVANFWVETLSATGDDFILNNSVSTTIENNYNLKNGITLTGSQCGQNRIINNTANADTSTPLVLGSSGGGVLGNYLENNVDFVLTDNNNKSAIVDLTTQSLLSSVRPAFSAKVSADITNVTGNGSIYTVLFNSEVNDQSSSYDTSTGKFTASVDGVYHFDTVLDLHAITSMSSLYCQFIVTGGGAAQYRFCSRVWASQNMTTLTETGSMTIPLTAGWTVHVTILGLGQGADTVTIGGGGNNQTLFSGYLVC
tara:strand:- start:869 stop:2344 length:1476 start_codon:yes stop_codon:yes gene_type:complete